MKLKKSKIILILMCFFPMSLLALNNQQVNRLGLLLHAWSVAKNYHSGACELNWDNELLAAIPGVINALDDEAFNDQLSFMLNKLGDNQVSPAEVPITPEWAIQFNHRSWLDSAVLSDNNKVYLTTLIESFRPRGNCFLLNGRVGEGAYDLDAQFYTVSSPSKSQRLLGLVRFWNIVDTYFPYKNLTDEPWEEVLLEFIPKVYNTVSVVDYQKQMRLMTARIKDSHAIFVSSFFEPFFSQAYLPFILKTVEGKVVIYKSEGNQNLGAELVSINGVSTAELIAEYSAFTAASNPSTLTRNIDGFLNRGHGDAVVVVKDSSGLNTMIETRYGANPEALNQISAQSYESMDQPTCSVGYVNMGLLEVDEVNAMMSSFSDKDAIVFDIRNYPNGTLWTLVDYLFEGPIHIATFAKPNLDYPGGFYASPTIIGQGTENPYAGRVIILLNEDTQSQAEYTVMGLEQHPNAVKIGSQTAAADGNVTWAFLPGNIIAYFTGLGTYYPDLTPTQRVGIVPDLFIKPSIEHVMAGRDEVLEAALDCQNIADLNWPGAVEPDPGLYWDPKLNGKGFDVHKAGDTYVLFSYDFRSDGSPVWHLGLAETEQGVLSLNGSMMSEHRFNYDSALLETIPLPSVLTMDFKRGFLLPECAVSSPENKVYPALFSWTTDESVDNRCMETLIFATAEPEVNLSGLWDGGENEHGWGLSVNMQGQQVVVLMYYYDSNGLATWLIGSGLMNSNEPVTLNMLKVTGFCTDCDDASVTTEVGGTITLSLQQVSDEFTDNNWVTISLGEGNLWNREQMPLKLLTDIRD